MIQKHTAAGEKSQGQTDLISPRKILILVTTRWYFFLAAIVIALALAYLYARFTVPVFRVSTTILMEEADHSRVQGMESQMLEGFGLNPAATNLENQLYVLTSWSLVGETLRDLPFETDVYTRGLSRKVSFYPMYPLRLVAETPGRVPYDIEFEFEYLEDNLFHLSTGSKAILQMDTIASFGQPIYTPRGTFRIFPHPDMEHLYKSSTKIYLKFNSHDALTEGYRNRLKVGPVSDESTIVQLSLEGTNRWKDQLFLDKLLEVFLARNLAKKNHEASRIIDFIDAQLGQVSDSLKITENQLQEFRSRNRIMDVSSQAQQIIDQSVVFENERARLTLESNYYQYLKEYLSKDNNQEVPISPATMGIEDPILARLMQELGGLQAEYFGTEMKEKNPLQAQLELRIRNTKESIRETLQGIMLANQMAVAENEQQIEALNARASILPEKERQLLGIERKFNLNNVLYTFLLQERAEAQIQKASNRPDNELIDSARAQKNPISPDRKKIFLLAFSLGIVLPLVFLILADLAKSSIHSEEDLKMVTSLPVVGHIPHSRLSYNTVVLNEPQSRVAEAFRTIRTRMEFLTRDTACPIIVVTSSIPGEGKTFAAINLASAYSLTGKRTLLMGFDLRRPTISASFELNGHPGLSTYLIGKNSVGEIIFETGHPNLSFIPSGPIPPNPGELANSARAMELLEGLRKRFDFIIIDSAPIGVVADNFRVASVADAILMIVRHGRTDRNHLRTTLSELQTSGVESIGLIVNDVKTRGGTYSYSYSYKYGEKYVRATQQV